MKKTLLLFLLIIGFTGCIRQETPVENVVARVKDRVLTASEVSAWEASLRQVSITEETRLAFIRRWVERELLYQEALSRNIPNDPWIAERLDEISQRLIVSRFIELDASRLPRPTPNQVKEYYKEHSSEFVWEHLHLEIEYWQSDTREGMDQLRARLLRGTQNTDWDIVPGSLVHERISLNGPASTDPSIWNIIVKLKEGEVSNLVPIKDSFWIFKLINHNEAGEAKGIDEVQDEILARLTEDDQQTRREELIRNLIDKYRREGFLHWSDAATTVTIIDTAN